MNDYQKALENIIVYPFKEDCKNGPCCQCNDVCDFYKSKIKDYEILKPLVEKATPKKAIVDYAGEFMEVNQYYCPTCKEYLDNVEGDFKYCTRCGQALDWSE